MFKCGQCGRQTAPGEKSQVVVVDTELHTFPRRLRANTFKRKGSVEHSDDEGGKGMQIVREIRVGKCCFSPE